MSKAYDRVEWCFVVKMLETMGFGPRFVDLISRCISSVSYQVLVNGFPTKSFTPSRGLRQGDPISPYLFLVCAEGFSALIRDRVHRGLLHGIRIANGAPVVSHLLFADDSLLFSRATVEEANEIISILKTYEAASGQLVNVDKSEVSFGRNVSENQRNLLLESLSFKAVHHHDKYLGLPTYIGRSKKLVFSHIQDRLWKKLKGWKEQYLSRAGKEVLIKSVAQAIPTYVMQCFEIPSSICSKMEGMCRDFWWGSNKESKGIPWLRWTKMCESKFVGGMGFRDFRCFNKALIAKQVWRLIQCPGSLVSRVLKAKYFKKCDIMEAKVGSQPSFLWRSLLWGRELLEHGLAWRIGNGTAVSLWHDNWVPPYSGKPTVLDKAGLDEGARVMELIDFEALCWKRSLLEMIFDQDMARSISSIPLCLNQTDDIRFWLHNDSGNYSVRSGYLEARRMQSSDDQAKGGSSIYGSKGWKKIWRTIVPPKIAHCMWRIWREALPVRTNLCSRGIDVDPRCPFCGEDYEHPTHLFLDCDFARKCWKISVLGWEVNDRSLISFQAWIQDVLERASDEIVAVCMTVLWAIWGARNQWIFENKFPDPAVTVAKAQCFLWEYSEPKMESATTNSTRDTISWSLPPPGFFKLNVDASPTKNGVGGIGLIIRDDEGKVAGVKQKQIKGNYDIETMEALAMREGLKFAKKIGCNKLLAHSDCRSVVEALAARNSGLKLSRAVIHDCLSIISEFSLIRFEHCYRETNKVAHSLASSAVSSVGEKEWLGGCPRSIETLVFADFV